MQTATIVGHVGSVKFTKLEANGEKPKVTLLSFNVATNAKTKAGKQITNWTTCKLWGPRAEALAPHVAKGQGVAVTGRPEANAYTTEAGPRSELVVHITEFNFMGGKPDGAPDNPILGEQAEDQEVPVEKE